jgi:hypothetical protein
MLPVLVSGKNVMLHQILRGSVKRERQQAHPITPDCPDAWDGSFPRVAPETRTLHRIVSLAQPIDSIRVQQSRMERN